MEERQTKRRKADTNKGEYGCLPFFCCLCLFLLLLCQCDADFALHVVEKRQAGTQLF